MNGSLYCSKCKNYAYHHLLDKILEDEQCEVMYIISKVKEPASQRALYKHWSPAADQEQKIQSACKSLPCLGNLGSSRSSGTQKHGCDLLYECHFANFYS